MHQFGSLLRDMRNSAGMSQEQLAEELHIARSSISKLERNQLELRAADLLRWAKVTENQDFLAAIILSVDVGVIQQILDVATVATVFLGTIFLGGAA